MSLRTAVPAACLLAILPANAQGWGTFYAAYEDGLAAQARGDHRTALQAFQAAAAKRPEPGARVKTYGLNFLNAYHPHLRAAECALALGDLEAADRALQASARFNAEPASTREALAQRLARAREAARPKDAPPAPRPADPRPAPRPVEPAPVEPRTAPGPTMPTLRPPAPEPRPAEPRPAPAEPKPAGLQPTPPAPTAQPAPTLTEAPATVPGTTQPPGAAEPPPLPRWLWVAGGGGALALLGLGALLARTRRPRLGDGLSRITSNPYGVDLTANTRGGGDATVLSPKAVENTTRKVGPYMITKVLGRGGCATTYLAVHEEDGTEVAVKIPHPHIVIDPDFLARFRREAELGAVLDHPRIVRILDPGPTDGDAWIAMTLVRGTTLESHLAGFRERDESIGLPELVHIAHDIAEAIAHAHSKGVVHRDLKPGNVMLGELGAQVMDFGIARVIDSSMTSTTVFIGTPNYSAPEAIVSPKVGPPADRYALGIILFEMLTGEVPFRGDTAFHVLDQHRSAKLPDLHAERPDAPPKLIRLVERLCAKRPDERPEDGEVIAILAALSAQFPLPTA
jgi:hypothetical protein